MKHNRDLLLTLAHLGFWIGLDLFGYASRIQIVSLSLLALAYFLSEWIQKSRGLSRTLVLFVGNGLVAYSLPALALAKEAGLVHGLFALAYDLSYFLQFDAFRKSVYKIFPTRKKKWIAAFFSSAAFGLVYLLCGPNFPRPSLALFATIPEKIQQRAAIAAVATALYAAVFLFVPNLGIKNRKK